MVIRDQERAQRRLNIVRNQQRTLQIRLSTTVRALRNACVEALDVLPIQVQNPSTMHPRPEDTNYIGSYQPQTDAERIAYGLRNIITHVVQPNDPEE